MAKLSELLRSVEYECSVDIEDVDIASITHDSREISRGYLFVATVGERYGGRNYINHAIAKGAYTIMIEKGQKCDIGDDKIIVIVVDNIRRAYSFIASNYYDNPTKNLASVGVIGTNGKTTCSEIIGIVLNKTNILTGVIGTLGAKYLDKNINFGMTTPDPMLLFSLIRDMVIAGVTHLVMEVSAHAIELSKVDAIVFDILLYTNISQDHLDYFLTMERYSDTKLSFFDLSHARCAVVNLDTVYSQRLIEQSNLIITKYSLNSKCDLYASKIRSENVGQKFCLVENGQSFVVNTSLIGRFNVYNLLGCIGVLRRIGLGMEGIINEIDNVLPIEGRCNLVSHHGVRYLIDYAHTPDGLHNVLKNAREMTDNRLMVVFGCGGNRDKSKRAIMGKIAGECADVVVVTTDNPRKEERHAIIGDILSGIECRDNVFACPDRKNAIEQAVSMATSGDIIVIAGKGCEQYIEEGSKKIPFNDQKVLYQVLGVNSD